MKKGVLFLLFVFIVSVLSFPVKPGTVSTLDAADILSKTEPRITSPCSEGMAWTPECVTSPNTFGTTSTPVPGSTTIIQPTGTSVAGIAGSYNLMILAGTLVGGVIISSANGNVVPTLNPLTGDVVVYNMDKGDKVVVDYTGEPAYNAKLSEGVEAEVQTPNRVRFTAYDDDSFFKIKSTDKPSYDFNNGLLEYENDNVLEQISTTETDSAMVDSDYQFGFSCVSLAGNASYYYVDKNDWKRSFSLSNTNRQSYDVCIRKTAYDEFGMSGQRYALIDIVKDKLRFKAKFRYFMTGLLALESFDERNDISIESGMGDRKIIITNSAPISNMISQTYSGKHLITEKLVNNEVIRTHKFAKANHPELINIYSTNFKDKMPDINIEDGMLIQQNKNKFTGLVEQNTYCLNEMLTLFKYNETEDFYQMC